jgi:dipeptidase
MGKLVEEYGFMSMANEITPGHQRGGEVAYDDAGESAILADSTGDVWVFNVAGGVANVTKGIWAAQRVPKGHLTVISNSYTVRELPLTPNDDFKFNTKIREACKAFGIWSDVDSNGKPNTVFDFAKTLGLENLTFRSGKGDPIPLYSSLRSWRILSLAAADPHMKLSLNINDMPFSVRVANKLSHRDVMSYFSDYYKDTEFDLTQGVLAGPFSLPYRLEGGPTQIGGQVPRGISIPRTSYSVLGQSAPSHGRSTRPAIVWFAIDQPMTSVYVPLVAKMNTTSVLGDENQVIDESYRVGTLLKFDRKSAFWAFDFVSNWMTINFRNMSTEVVFPAQKKLQDAIDEKIESELIPMLSSNSHMAKVGDWQRELQNWVVSTWWALSDDLIVIYNDGYFSRIKSEYLSDAYPEVIGKSYGLPKWWGEMVGITDDIHPIWVQPSTVLNTATLPIGCCAVPKNQVPSKFDEKALKWVYANQEQFMEPTINGVESNVTDADENWKYTPSNSVLGTFLASTLSAVGGLATGYFIAKKQFDLFSSPKRRPLLEDC